MPRKKKRPPPTADELTILFDDEFIACLAQEAKLPSHADIQLFAKLIRDAVRQYYADVPIPTSTEINNIIKALYSAADRRRHKELANRMGKIPERALILLKMRADDLGLEVPEPEAFTDCKRQDEACKIIVRLLRIGWKDREPLLYVPPSVNEQKAERDFEAYLHATGKSPSVNERKRHFEKLAYLHSIGGPPSLDKRKAERDLVSGLRLAYLYATGDAPAYTANPTQPGPFADMVQKCLDRVIGIGAVNAVEMINKLQLRRKQMESGTTPNS